MTEPSHTPSSLPIEFTRSSVRFSIFRCLGLAAIMLLAGILAWPQKTKPNDSKTIGQLEPLVDTIQSDITPVVASSHLPASYKNFYGRKNQKGLRAFVKHEKIRRGFVAADVLNIRKSPTGKVIAQLARGEAVEILSWEKASEFVKIKTNFELVGFASSNLLSIERPTGFFDVVEKSMWGSDDITLKLGQEPADFEFRRDYDDFNQRLKELPIKPSFDFLKSNLKYLLVSSSNIIFPSDAAIILDWIRQSSYRPNVFFDLLESKEKPAEPSGIRMQFRLPVRRVLANGSAFSTTLNAVDLSHSCSSPGISVKMAEPSREKLELLVIDVKKSSVVNMTTRPHKGHPSYTWGYADLNGDSWQDLAFYFGGETPISGFKRLFVAQNMNGHWQLRWVEDRAGSKIECS